MHGPINVKSSNNNISKWQMGFNSAFNGLNLVDWSAACLDHLIPGKELPSLVG
jgi:hypothetical protein